MRGATDVLEAQAKAEAISIHAPREGSDTQVGENVTVTGGISIHAPREGSDVYNVVTNKDKTISIHAPREGSDC